MYVASSREDAWIETLFAGLESHCKSVASSREDAWIETAIGALLSGSASRVLPRGRVD